jgi:hypothetical protein
MQEAYDSLVGGNASQSYGDLNSSSYEQVAKTPNVLDPFSVYTNPGSGQVRWYDENGNPLMDMDYDHDHGGVGSPHGHTWSNGVRGAATPVAPLD